MRYTRNNLKWSHGEVKDFTDGMVSGLSTMGVTKNTPVLTWLPNTCPEQHILQFAASKSGYVLHSLPHTATSPSALATALTSSKAKVLFTPSAIDDTDYLRIVRSVIPDVEAHDESLGLFFSSEAFPHLRYIVQTGFDLEDGMYNYKNVMSFNGAAESVEVGEKDLVGVSMGEDGKPGKSFTNADVSKVEGWGVVNNIAGKTYTECDNDYNEGFPY